MVNAQSWFYDDDDDDNDNEFKASLQQVENFSYLYNDSVFLKADFGSVARAGPNFTGP